MTDRDYVVGGLKGLVYLLQDDSQAEINPKNTLRNICAQVGNIAYGCRVVLREKAPQ